MWLQEAKKQEEKAAREAGLEGKDAFEELKKLSQSDSLHHNDPREDLERLYRDANEGIPVAGRPATWEATRPTVLPAGKPVKHRGFIDYRRSTSLTIYLLEQQSSGICIGHQGHTSPLE